MAAATTWSRACLGICLFLGRLCAGAKQLDLKIIGAGPSRTGTQSLRFALRILGYRSSHGHHYLWNPRLRRPWKKWLHWGAPLEPALRALANEGMNATLDVPFFAAYKELMQRFPDAKVILTVRDADLWYRSIMAFGPIYRSWYVSAFALVKLYWYSGFSWGEARLGLRMFKQDYLKLLDCDTERELYDPTGRRRCIHGYLRLEAEVMREVPPDRLLVFDVKDGWGPLCKFLGVEVPSVPFPRHDDLLPLHSNAFVAVVRWATKLLALLLCFGLLCCWWCRRCCRRRAPAPDFAEGLAAKKVA